MYDWLTISTRANPNQIALITADRQWTYRDLDQMVDTTCGWLHQQGIREGQTIAVLMPNRVEYVLLIHALMRLGAILVPLNTRLTPPELSYQLEKVAAKLVIGSGETRSTANQLPCPAVEFASSMLPAFSGTPSTRRTLTLSDPQAIMFTSGTTGKPKGAVLTYANHFYGALASAYRIGTLPGDRWLCCLPLYHVGGLNIITRCCLYGTAIVLHQGFDLAQVRAALAHQAVTLISLVPTMLYRLLTDTELLQAPALRLVLLGGAAATPELLTLAAAANIPVATTYGLTEADSQVATQTPASTARKPGSVGKPLPFNTIEILNEAGEPVADAEYGEIVVSGPTLMSGYFAEPEATARTLRDGRLYTGDLGYFDADGDLWIVQRRSDLIVSGGENVYPAEVEAVLRQHPAVADACVVGLPDAEWGQQVAAAIQLKPDAQAETAEIIAFCRGLLAGYKVPRRLRFVDQLPLTGSGKVAREAVAQLLSSEDPLAH